MSGYRNRVDTSECYFCSQNSSVEVHHIVPQRFNGSDRQENLVAVCDSCHKKLEALYDKRFYEKLGIEDEEGSRKAHFECITHDCSRRADYRVHIPNGGNHYKCVEHAARSLARKNVSRDRVENYAFPVSDNDIESLVSVMNAHAAKKLKSLGGGLE